MTFAAFENSIEGSQPIELYRFVQGSTTFEYTSAEDTVTVGGLDYGPEPIERSRIGQSQENKSNALIVTVPGDNEFVKQFVTVVPGSRVKFTLQRVQRPDFPGPEVVTMFSGFVQSVSFEEDAVTAKVAVIPLPSAGDRPVPRFTYMSKCNHVLYDDRCKVSDTDPAFNHSGTVLSVSGSTITVDGASGFVDGFFESGIAEGSGGADPRMILKHTGDTLQLLLPFSTDILGTTLTVLAGCDRSIEVCGSKFFTPEDTSSNIINFGGFFWVPTKNIFTAGLD